MTREYIIELSGPPEDVQEVERQICQLLSHPGLRVTIDAQTLPVQTNTPIPDSLPRQTRNVLTGRLGANCIEDLARFSEVDLQKLGMIGPKTIAIIRELLARVGLTLREEGVEGGVAPIERKRENKNQHP